MAAMLVIYTSKGVALEVNLREGISCMFPPSVNKAAPSGFETQRRHHQKSETVTPKLDVSKKAFSYRKWPNHSEVVVEFSLIGVEVSIEFSDFSEFRQSDKSLMQ